MDTNVDKTKTENPLPKCPAGLTHRGVMAHRLNYDQKWHGNRRENAFALAWERENAMTGELRVTGATRDERGILDSLLSERSNMLFYDEKRLAPYNQEAAVIAATVMQWLGTNIGFGWLENTLDEAGYTIARKDTRE